MHIYLCVPNAGHSYFILDIKVILHDSAYKNMLRGDQTNGLAFIIEKMKGAEIYAHINLEKGVRSELAELASKIL